FGRALNEDRIGIVDMNINATARQACERCKRACFARYWHVPHAKGSFAASLRSLQFIIMEKRAVEEDNMGAGETFSHCCGKRRGCGDIDQPSAASAEL